MSQPRSLPVPGPEHEKLVPFVGKFRAKVKFWAGGPEPFESQGTMVNLFQLGGLYLHQDYVSDSLDASGPTFSGKGYWGFNPATKQYEGFWIDNASCMMQTEKGNVDEAGTVWTMHSEFTHPATGARMRKQSTIRLIDSDQHTITSDFIDANGKEIRVMEIEYTRMKDE